MNKITLIFMLFSSLSYGAVNTSVSHSISQKSKKEGVAYAVLFKDEQALCVTSLDDKSNLIPDSLQISSTAKKVYDSEQDLSLSLSLPICDQDLLSQSIQKQIQHSQILDAQPEQVAFLGMALFPAFSWIGVTLTAGACVSGYYAGKHAVKRDEKFIYSGSLTFLIWLMPGVIKAPFVCGLAGAIINGISFYNVDRIMEDMDESMPEEDDDIFSDGIVVNHPFLNSVVTISSSAKVIKPGSNEDEDEDEEENEKNENEDEEGLIEIIKDGLKLGHYNFTTIGSGFFIDDDKVVTNYHVVDLKKHMIPSKDYKTRIKIEMSNGQKVTVTKILASDSDLDLAVLQLDTPVGTPVKLGDSDQLQLLDEVIVSGSPNGLKGSLTKGNISQFRMKSSKKTKKNVSQSKAKSGRNLIQYTSPTSQGNSGGALFLEETHELVGVPVFIMGSLFGSGQNLNFAITVNDVKKFLRENNIEFSE